MSSMDTDLVHRAMPLTATLGMTCEEWTPTRVVLALDHRPDLCTAGGLMHGGAVMALADAAGGGAAHLNRPDDAAGTSTIESKTNFLGPVREGGVRATATVLHRGRSTIVVETEVRQADRLVAKTTQTQSVLHR
jgi:1,4-dihydroxy-2-naphthoyl-CoA hydrolase